jgi:hypothetical protein
VGGLIYTLEDGVRWVTFGAGEDLIEERVAPLPGPDVGQLAEQVVVRGREGHLVFTVRRGTPSDVRVIQQDLMVSISALQWEQDGCSYQVQLPGLTHDEAREYAARF